MTPAARYAAAIEILDHVLAGAPAERALTNWARSHRFAGSKDRAAIRDHVFEALRRRRSYAALGGAETGRGLMLGALREAGDDPGTVFSGDKFAPTPLTSEERSAGRRPKPGAEEIDCPDWLWPKVRDDLGDHAHAVFACQRDPAPVGVRVNLQKTSRDDLAKRFAEHGVEAKPVDLSPSALVLEGRPRGLIQLPMWHDGLFELQDAGSQWVADHIPLQAGDTMVDYCAGGGGKTLAVAARVDGVFFAHDADAGRMRDIPVRAARAGLKINVVSNAHDLPKAATVVADVPCTGSGTWRRSPDSKWRLTAAELDRLTLVQAKILRQSADLVASGGALVYITCSILCCENADQISAFVNTSEFTEVRTTQLLPNALHDGYFVSVLKRN